MPVMEPSGCRERRRSEEEEEGCRRLKGCCVFPWKLFQCRLCLRRAFKTENTTGKICQNRLQPRAHVLRKSQNVPEKIPVKTFRATGCHVRSGRAAITPEPFPGALETDPARIVQPDHRVGEPQPFRERPPVIAVHDPGIGAQDPGEFCIEMVSGRHHPSRSPPEPVQMMHRKPEPLPQPPCQFGFPAPPQPMTRIRLIRPP